MPFDPDQPRDENGQWTATGSGSAIKRAASDRGKLTKMPKVVASEEEAKEAIEIFKRIADRDEIEAVGEYTYKPNEKYKDINGAFRVGEKPKGYEETVSNIDRALRDAPKYDGETFRGIGFSSKEVYEKLKSDFEDNFEFVDAAYGSTSVDRNRALNYLKDNKDANYAIMLTVKGKNGVYLGSLSKTPEDREVMMPRSTPYRVDSMAEYDWKENGKLLIAVIEEIE